MRRLYFRNYNQKIEIENILNILFGKPNFGQTKKGNIFPFSEKFVNNLKKLSSQKQKDLIKKDITNKLLREIIFGQKNYLEKIWYPNLEKKYFNVTQKFLDIKLSKSDVFSAYFTYMHLCSYSEKKNYFFISVWTSPIYQINIIAHELLHLLFIKYYKRYCLRKGLTKNQFENLKEALTFIINKDIYKGIILANDFGYPHHKKFRELLHKEWVKNKNFKKLLDYGIKYSKSNFPK